MAPLSHGINADQNSSAETHLPLQLQLPQTRSRRKREWSTTFIVLEKAARRCEVVEMSTSNAFPVPEVMIPAFFQGLLGERGRMQVRVAPRHPRRLRQPAGTPGLVCLHVKRALMLERHEAVAELHRGNHP